MRQLRLWLPLLLSKLPVLLWLVLLVPERGVRRNERNKLRVQLHLVLLHLLRPTGPVKTKKWLSSPSGRDQKGDAVRVCRLRDSDQNILGRITEATKAVAGEAGRSRARPPRLRGSVQGNCQPLAAGRTLVFGGG